MSITTNPPSLPRGIELLRDIEFHLYEPMYPDLVPAVKARV